MKKYMLTITMSLLIGFLLSFYILKEYENPNIFPTFKENETAYLIQQGVYSSMESMQENTTHLSDYIYSVIDNMYYVYIGISLNSENVNKLQKYYKEKNIDTIIKTTTLTDKQLIETLRQYDMVLSNTTDENTIGEICKQVLSKYQQ